MRIALRIIAYILLILLVVVLLAWPNRARMTYLLEFNPDHRVIVKWLGQRDPEVFDRCKLFLHKSDRSYARKKDKEFTRISAMICGNVTTFWINNQTKHIDCYISYCGKNIGNKYCGDQMTAKACEQ